MSPRQAELPTSDDLRLLYVGCRVFFLSVCEIKRPHERFTLCIGTDHERKSPYRTALVDADEETGSRTWSDSGNRDPAQDLSRIEDD